MDKYYKNVYCRLKMYTYFKKVTIYLYKFEMRYQYAFETLFGIHVSMFPIICLEISNCFPPSIL